MTRLREQWLETLSICVTGVLLVFVYMVLVQYDRPSMASHASFALASDR